LIALIDFIIPNKFNIVEPKASLFLVQPDVFQELLQLLSTRVLNLEHFKTQGQVFSNQGKYDVGNTTKVIQNLLFQNIFVILILFFEF
jgi:hypothetical protein